MASASVVSGSTMGTPSPRTPGRFSVIVLLELVQTHQIEVEHGPIGVGEAQIGLLRGVERREIRGVDLFDDVVGRHDPRIVVVPRERTHGIVGAERFVGSPLCEPVVADIAANGDVAVMDSVAIWMAGRAKSQAWPSLA